MKVYSWPAVVISVIVSVFMSYVAIMHNSQMEYSDNNGVKWFDLLKLAFLWLFFSYFLLVGVFNILWIVVKKVVTFLQKNASKKQSDNYLAKMESTTLRNKASAIILVNVLLISIVAFSFDLSIENVARIITGNFLADSFMNLLLNIPFLILFFVIRRSFKEALAFLLIFNLLWFFLDLIAIVLGPFIPLFPPDEWQYVRSCVGAGFLVFGISILGLFKWNINKWEFLPRVGLFAPFLALCAVLVAMKQHRFTWLFFLD